MRLRQSGMTLMELMIVVMILGVLAASASTARWADESVRLDIAATRIADVLRHARDRAATTGTVTGVEVTPGGIVSAHRMNLGVLPPVSAEVLRHPVSRQPLSFDVLNDRATRGVTLTTTTPFISSLEGSSGWLLFDADGAGFWIDGNGDAHLMTSTSWPIIVADATRTISVDPYTGRVAVSDP